MGAAGVAPDGDRFRRRWRRPLHRPGRVRGRSLEPGPERRLSITGVAGLVADVDQFGAEFADRVLGLRQIGAQDVEFGSERIERCRLLDDCGLRPHGQLLGGCPTLLRPLQLRTQVGLGRLASTGVEQGLQLVLPARGTLQPEHPDGIDQLGDGTHGDRSPERVVGLDRPAQPAERPGGDPGGTEMRTQLLRVRQRPLSPVGLLGERDGELDRRAEIAVLDLDRLGHESRILHAVAITNARS